MPGVSIHVVDVSRGLVAAGMKVEFHAVVPARRLIAGGTVSPKGLLDDPAQHYHLPFKVTPWGYSCFRGGA